MLMVLASAWIRVILRHAVHYYGSTLLWQYSWQYTTVAVQLAVQLAVQVAVQAGNTAGCFFLLGYMWGVIPSAVGF